MPPILFDTHTHFNFNAFRDDWKETIERTLAKNVWFVNVGAESKTSARAVDIAEKYPEGVFAAVGLHPIHTYDDILEEEIKGEKVKFETKAEDFDEKYYAGLIESNDKVVAIGETGLDYFHIKKFSPGLRKKLKQKQSEIFIKQLKLAAEHKKPIIVHCRPDKNYDAYEEILEILKEYPVGSMFTHVGSRLNPNVGSRLNLEPTEKDSIKRKLGDGKQPGIVHCFQGNEKILEEFLNLGFMIGYNGVITFTEEYDDLVRATPINRIVLETDSPWLAPVPHRGKRNESIYVKYVARKIAKLKGLDFNELARVTTENARRVLGLI